jgi:hypothetical protein
VTQEPHRAEKALICEGATFYSWDILSGISTTKDSRQVEDITDPADAMIWLGKQRDSVLIMHNVHLHFDSPHVIQAILNGTHLWKGFGNCLVLVSPICQLPVEVEKYFHLIDLPLPSVNELIGIMEDIAEAAQIEPNIHAAMAAKGLTEFEAETAFALSAVKKRSLDPRIIAEAKAQMIRRSGLMEFWPPVPITDVGGLDELKMWLGTRAMAYMPGNEHLPKPKGVLLVGIPGTGKSLSAKAAASIFGWPLIRLDISTLKSKYVGESENKMKLAMQTINAFGRAVIWCDEIEKALSGASNSGETGDTTGAMLGILLTAMQEQMEESLLIATANNAASLPAEFLRRFDEIFFVDTPGENERIDIIRIMNQKYATQIPEEAATKLEGYTGAEIEKIARNSHFDGLEKAISRVVPITKTSKEVIEALREWAKSRAQRANAEEVQAPQGRRLKMVIGDTQPAFAE